MAEKLEVGDEFEATYMGGRYRFTASEAYNLGSGYMCFELEGKLPSHVHSSSAMTEIKILKKANWA